MCTEDVLGQWRPELEKWILLLSDPMRDYSSGKVVSLETDFWNSVTEIWWLIEWRAGGKEWVVERKWWQWVYFFKPQVFTDDVIKWQNMKRGNRDYKLWMTTNVCMHTQKYRVCTLNKYCYGVNWSFGRRKFCKHQKLFWINVNVVVSKSS